MALYITKAELITVSISEVVDMITESNDTIVTTIIEETMDIFTTYLGGLYDMETILAKTGTERSKSLMKYMKDVTIYQIYIRNTKEMNEVAKLQYDEAILWLDKVSKGQLELNLPYASGEDEDGDGNPDGDLFLHTGKGTYQNDF